ncbi:potassium channel family protein [Limosilactobacillus sp. STM2_1]|uniref:Potassium channel family protein n=1 Tax=Limosilactobacillus rudii TaxID=2759755 RepID=A0A7W3UJX9_9LACO|nr:potassium channel family protein [Limosilactobacillus rudii]MBB1079137.1 potassium channel family protein [Limosilactobacillus rudii]MBB1096988.1 potassium channel family protein [Limosilactobacillus rudii]MCD7133956.1 potassium channel family protein [Limosilactobacillus rudii]
MHNKFTYIIYQIIMALLAVVSIVMLIAYYANRINIDAYPYDMIDNGIWLVFFADYFIRLILAPNKREFVRNNIFDLLSIIPASSLFFIFRIAQVGRTFRLLKLIRIMRLVGFTGRLGVFFERNELLYYSYISIAVIIVAAAMFCISEKVSFETALWWAITTATTIGYGDVIPKTGIGRAAAIVLMLLGIGFIGMLTSTINEFFAKKDEQKLSAQLDQIQTENRQLKAELDEIKTLIKNKKLP